ncbi:hypothetical protein BTO20_33995 [Mycobacterium dioxanotrophicus]|uniref:Uncharacterized protein n=1 Tax=Mycobacterium dioxanotrophicus TaxID=482462 RepID=A0A1Y0CCY0_9MYCO|nr:hypothetical protein BTO20_33995 [Mycobacterium dioxanotrophicus]
MSAAKPAEPSVAGVAFVRTHPPTEAPCEIVWKCRLFPFQRCERDIDGINAIIAGDPDENRVEFSDRQSRTSEFHDVPGQFALTMWSCLVAAAAVMMSAALVGLRGDDGSMRVHA